MKYYTQARLFPTILTSVPLLVVIFLIVSLFNDQLSAVVAFLPAATIASFYAAFVFLFVQINRIISKEFFQNIIYRDELYMPTTCKLLWTDTSYDDRIKVRLHDKINQMYQVQLMSKDDELTDELSARKLIVAVVAQMRNTLRPNKMLLQHNIEYGFFRNLVGGSVLAVVISVGLLIYSYYIQNSTLQAASWFMTAIYLLPILMSKVIINKLGNYYTKILIEQFLSHQ